MKIWKSGVYSLGGQLIDLAVNIGTVAVLGRLLSPAEFGLFGLALAVYSLISPFVDLGLTPVYLKLEKVEQDTSDVFFTLNFIVGLIASLFMALAAPFFAYFYNHKELTLMVILLAVSIFIRSITSQPRAVLIRNKRFDQTNIVKIIPSIIGSGFVILFAWLGFSYWALVSRYLIQSIVSLFLYSLFSDGKYRLVRVNDIKRYWKSIRFGGEIVIGRIYSSILSSIDQFAIGKVLGLSATGLYNRAYNLAKIPDGNLRAALTAPALSYLARIKGGARAEHYLTFSWVIFLIAGTPSIIFIIVGDWLMPWYMGDQWVEAGILLQWLGIWGLGQIYRGLANIFHLDQMAISRWNRLILINIPLTYSLPLWLLLQEKSLILFVITYSIFHYLFWVLTYFGTMFTRLKRDQSIIIAFLKQIGITALIVSAGLVIKGGAWLGSLPSFLGGLEKIAVVAILSILLMIILLLIIGRNEIKHIWLYIKK